MAQQFDRKFSLKVGPVEINSGSGPRPLKIEFNIFRSLDRAANVAEFKLNNLSRAQAAGLVEPRPGIVGIPVEFRAGYQSDSSLALAFIGQLQRAETTRRGTERITLVTSGDGDAALRETRVNKLFPQGTPLSVLLLRLLETMPFPTSNVAAAIAAYEAQNGPLVDRNGRSVLVRPLTVVGFAADRIEAFCRSLGVTWHILDSKLEVSFDADRGAGVDVFGPLLTPETGLLEDPVVDSKGFVKVKALLNLDILPGRRIRVEHPDFQGQLKVVATTHTGDSYGNPWWVVAKGRLER